MWVCLFISVCSFFFSVILWVCSMLVSVMCIDLVSEVLLLLLWLVISVIGVVSVMLVFLMLSRLEILM